MKHISRSKQHCVAINDVATAVLLGITRLEQNQEWCSDISTLLEFFATIQVNVPARSSKEIASVDEYGETHVHVGLYWDHERTLKNDDELWEL